MGGFFCRVGTHFVRPRVRQVRDIPQTFTCQSIEGVDDAKVDHHVRGDEARYGGYSSCQSNCPTIAAGIPTSVCASITSDQCASQNAATHLARRAHHRSASVAPGIAGHVLAVATAHTSRFPIPVACSEGPAVGAGAVQIVVAKVQTAARHAGPP